MRVLAVYPWYGQSYGKGRAMERKVRARVRRHELSALEPERAVLQHACKGPHLPPTLSGHCECQSLKRCTMRPDQWIHAARHLCVGRCLLLFQSLVPDDHGPPCLDSRLGGKEWRNG